MRTHTDHYHHAETIQNHTRNIMVAKIRILIEDTPRSAIGLLPDGTGIFMSR